MLFDNMSYVESKYSSVFYGLDDLVRRNYYFLFNIYFSRLKCIKSDDSNSEDTLLFESLDDGTKYITGKNENIVYLSPVNGMIDISKNYLAAYIAKDEISIIKIEDESLMIVSYSANSKFDSLLAKIYDKQALELLIENGLSFNNISNIFDLIKSLRLHSDLNVNVDDNLLDKDYRSWILKDGYVVYFQKEKRINNMLFVPAVYHILLELLEKSKELENENGFEYKFIQNKNECD